MYFHACRNLIVTFGLCFVTASALKCNHCVPSGSGGRCTNTIETCGYKKDACVSARFTIYPCMSFVSCVSLRSLHFQCCYYNMKASVSNITNIIARLVLSAHLWFTVASLMAKHTHTHKMYIYCPSISSLIHILHMLHLKA